MCYSSHFKDTRTLENQLFFKRMEFFIFDTQWPFSTIIYPLHLRSAVPVKAAYLHQEKIVT